MTNDFEVITFDSRTYGRQAEYNRTYAADVNKVLADLKAQLPDLSNEDMITFLATPDSLIKRLENAAWEEYSAYIQSLPPSVGNSIKFHFNKGETINRLHKRLPQPSTYFFTINTCKIKDGICIFDEETLKQKCTIKGSPDTLKAWQTANEIADALNKLEKTLKGLHPEMLAVENVAAREMGLIRSTENGYVADIDRLKQLI